MSIQKVLKGTTPWLTTYPRATGGANYNDNADRDFVTGQPTAGTTYVQVYCPYSQPASIDTWVSATRDPMSATTSGVTSEGATSITVTASKTWSRGTIYLVKTTSGNTHQVNCAKSVTGTTLYVTDPILEDIPSGSDVLGFFITYQLTANQTSLIGPGHAIWKCTINTFEYRWSQQFVIVERLPTSVLTPNRLLGDYPIMAPTRDGSDVDLEKIISAAWRHEILPFLHANKIAEENVVSVEELEPLHALACVISALRQRPDVDQSFFDRMNDRYTQLKETTLASSHWYEVRQEDNPPILPARQTAMPKSTGIRISR